MKSMIIIALLSISIGFTHAQNVGIGTTAPLQKLHVIGNAAISGSVGIGTTTPAYPLTVMAPSGKGIVQKDGDVEVGFYTSGGGLAILQTWSNHPLLFATNNGSPAMILGTNGNLGIGTASNLNNTHRLRVQGETFLTSNVGIGIAPSDVMLHVAGNAIIAGSTEVSSLEIGSIGTTISALQHGTLTIGPGATQQIVATLVFPNSFTSIPRLFVMPKHQPGFINNDAFSVTIKTISTTQATLVVRRLDSNAAWDQNLVIDWLALR